MQIAREEFLRKLQMILPGVANREMMEQTASIVFKGGSALSFNDEIACSVKTGFPDDFLCAVPAKPLIGILNKIPDENVEIILDGDELTIYAGKKETIMRTEIEIRLPYDELVVKPKKWEELSPRFLEAISLVHHCVSKDETKGELTCIHVNKDRIEANDSYHAARVKFETGVKSPYLARGDALKHLPTLGVREVSESGTWLHFRNKEMMFSCRCYVQDYSDIDRYFKIKGKKLNLPKGIEGAVDRASEFSADNADDNLVSVSLRKGKMRIRGEGVKGSHSEPLSVAYESDPFEFMIPPDLMKDIAKEHNECLVGHWDGVLKMKIKGEDWEYVTILNELKGERNGEA